MTTKILKVLVEKKPTTKTDLAIYANTTKTKLDRYLGEAIGLFDAYNDAMEGDYTKAEKMLNEIENEKPGRIGFIFPGQKSEDMKEWQYMLGPKATSEEKAQWWKTYHKKSKRREQLQINRKNYLDRKKREKELTEKNN